MLQPILKETANMLLNKTRFFFIFIIAIAISAAGCSAVPILNPATATPTEVPATSTALPSPTVIPPTAKPLPTKTATPTTAPLPALAVVPDGINPWCLPITFIKHVDGPNGPASMPEGGRPGAVDKTTSRINFHIPAVSCTLILAFNQPIPNGMILQVWDARPQEPWITYEMNANLNNPKEGYVIFTHSYIINPPKWWMDYTIVVKTAEGKEIFRNPVRFFKSLPEKCWDDSLPNPITLFCPIEDS
ncbi:MAG: hypothetical protein WCG34_06565 [Leptolinea sp.]